MCTDLSWVPSVADDSSQRKKANNIRKAIHSDAVDVSWLRQLAISPDGLINNDIRKMAWPTLLEVDVDNIPAKPGMYNGENLVRVFSVIYIYIQSTHVSWKITSSFSRFWKCHSIWKNWELSWKTFALKRLWLNIVNLIIGVRRRLYYKNVNDWSYVEYIWNALIDKKSILFYLIYFLKLLYQFHWVLNLPFNNKVIDPKLGGSILGLQEYFS